MHNVLVIHSSLNQGKGNSSQLVAQYVQKLSQRGNVNVVTRDLMQDNLPHLSAQEMSTWMIPVEERSAEAQQQAAFSDRIVEEVHNADEIVLGVPMYNFGIPSVLKAWIDRLARAGVTFKYTETGPVGLLKDKKVTIIAARGGIYAGTEFDTQSAYLTHFFNFVGLTDISFIYAEGLAMGDESAQQAMSTANQKMDELAA
ncbi:FMN-dependent NADH-azoreductase [Alteromonas ponticola]|uniref:FMN dependent NADH:quinone oxidoreductase n=1 Tax=Alteromonas ponticola TaxID=2720613 RepID=A0ABX1R4S8_9ALTE|nr:NAD(P)H-dependent oxidoreductase [Alteromonas ponticola]NMH60501.1 FMN-dependent NADH-azoreductase [Alteromonas ponticola]